MTRIATPIVRCGVMDGDGHSSSPTRPTSKWRSITRKTAWGVTSPPRRQTGFTSKVIQFSPKSKQQDVTDAAFQKLFKEICDEKVCVGNHRRSWTGRCELVPT